MNIIITGSLGHVGLPLTKALAQKGHTVTVISSKPEKQKDIEALGARAAIGALEDLDFLTVAFAGADAVYCMIPPNFGELDQLAYYRRISDHYARAIQQSGVPRVVHLSSYGAHLDRGTGFILGSHHAENILNALPEVAITHLRAGYFYYNLYNFVGMIKHQGMIGSNYGGDDKIILVHPSDIAAAAAEELVAPATGKKVRYVVSDEHTANEIAHVLGAAIGQPDLSWLIFTDAQTQEGLEKNGLPVQLAAKFVELGAGLHSGRLLQDYEQHRPLTLGKVKLEDFAQEFAARYGM